MLCMVLYTNIVFHLHHVYIWGIWGKMLRRRQGAFHGISPIYNCTTTYIICVYEITNTRYRYVVDTSDKTDKHDTKHNTCTAPFAIINLKYKTAISQKPYYASDQHNISMWPLSLYCTAHCTFATFCPFETCNMCNNLCVWRGPHSSLPPVTL